MNKQRPMLYLSDSLADPLFSATDRDGAIVLLVTHDDLFVEIDGHGYRLKRGNLVTLFPTHTITLRGQSEHAACVWLWFAFDFMADFPLLLPPEMAERFGATPVSLLSDVDFNVLEQTYETLAKYDAATEHPLRMGLLKAQLFIFVSELLHRSADCAVAVQGRRAETLSDTFFALLHRHYMTERSLAFYADQLCITTKYLSKVIRRTTGRTVYYWIEEFVAKEAKRLLRSTDATVTEIAERLNFSNSSFFAKFFRRHTGRSPLEYRNRMK